MSRARVGKRRQSALRMVGCFVFLTLAGSVNSAWAVDLSGEWSGRWESFNTGHNGPLHAHFTRLSHDVYRVDFRGRFFKLVPFRYSVMLRVVEQSDSHVTLAGSSYLGRMFGTFHYRATASACCFTANYSSCDDRGQFVMKKVCG